MELSQKKKLIVIKPSGNHSNRLLQNLHFEAFCKEYNIEYQNPTLVDMEGYYAEPCTVKTNLFFKILQIDLLGKLFHHSKVIKKIFSVVWIFSKLSLLIFIRFDTEKEANQYETMLLKAFEKNNIVYVGGWKFRLPVLAEKYKLEMSKKYALKQSFYENNSLVQETTKLKSEGYTLIGIHIRRGDYKKWKGGTYYFEDDVYLKYMDNISEKLLKQGKEKHVFILFSNDNFSFQASSRILISKENWYIDQHIMSTCDYLIGPFSTFTLWAAYIGNVKLFHINNSDADLSSILN